MTSNTHSAINAQMRSDSAQLTIDLTAIGDPIAGHLTAFGGAPRPFTGWLQLMSGLQEAVETLRDQTNNEPGAGTG